MALISEVIGTPHRFFEESEHPNRLQEIIQVIVECCWWIWAVDVGVEFLCVRFDEGRFLKLGIYIEVAESKPVVERHGSEHEHDRERPKVEL